MLAWKNRNSVVQKAAWHQLENSFRAGPVKGTFCYKGLAKGLAFMSKWKRKKYEQMGKPKEEEFSPLGLSLLEQFGSGLSVTWQHLISSNDSKVFLILLFALGWKLRAPL